MNEAFDRDDKGNAISRSEDKNQPSLTSLIIWNVSKALQKNPHVDLRRAMRSAHERMEHQSHDVNDLISQYPEDRHVTCAVLAWQQLGHKDTESLYEFIETHRNKILRNTSENSRRKENIYSVNISDASKKPKGFIDHKPSVYRNSVESTSFDTNSLIGPVVKLPVETKVVMRVENTAPCSRHNAKKAPKSDIKNKLDAACCLDSGCVERLKEMEKSTAELRSRAAQLARREAERAELLERAEAAWRDLELGYQRRLLLAEEKEEDIIKQIKKSIEDRNAYKHACTVLAQQLGKRGDIVENDRAHLTQVEKEVCDLACTRLRLSEESTKGDAAVADQQCKTVQLERDLQFKEEQARRKLLSIESVMDSARGLTLEAERALRGELGAIKEQIAQVSSQLLEEDAENNGIKTELDELRQQKIDIFEDLEGCKQMCDNRMQGIVDELNNKRQMLNELKDKAIECQCKLPLDVAVEVKRTPSLAALCRCAPEEHILHSCSCTSVRSTLLSNLLADLFGGLQAELGDTGSLMPCQLLKCLEDKHNWDRASIVKSNLRSFFSQLLVGELDTAIATSIEKYHATWVGVSCADKARMLPEPGEVENEGWQERALERRAQKLAGQLAEQLFQERSEQLVQRAKDIVTSGPPPCECHQQTNKATAYPCLVKPLTIGGNSKRSDVTYPNYVRKTLQDFTILRTQLEDLKKESIKKEDLRMMEEKITKIVQQASGPDNTALVPKKTTMEVHTGKQKLTHTHINTDFFSEMGENKNSFVKKKNMNLGPIKKSNKKSVDGNERLLDTKLTGKTIKKMEQSYAVNLCLFDGKKKPNCKIQKVTCTDNLNIWEAKLSQNVLSQIPSIKHSRPIDKIIPKNNQGGNNKKKSSKIRCLNKCKCFHKVPSNTSIDKLLKTLLKWDGDLVNYSIFNMGPPILSKSKSNFKEIHHDSEYSNNKVSINISDVEETRSHNFNNIKSAKACEIDQSPPLTTSEYIGAINLDKSNEHICKCIIKGDNENIPGPENNISHANLLFKCLDTGNCNCKMGNELQNTDLVYQSVKSLDKNSNVKALTNIKQLNDENASLSHKNNQTSESNFLTNDSEALVKFLGVTLKDIKERKSSASKKGYGKCDKSSYNTSILNHIPPDFYSKLVSSVKSDKQKETFDIKCIDLKTECQSKTNLCEFVETYPGLQDNIAGYKGNISEQKTHQCLGEILSEKKSCVCCNYDDETKNLEVNTLCLLEKHLKHKLAEFRKSSGKSTCFLADEEEKVFVTILEKVKQVISNCTYNIKCECSVTSNESGNWTRFHNLLEEYLKIKIKRARCSCVTNKDSLDTALPSVLEQVSNLIENDFERLKKLCRIQTSNGLEYDTRSYDHNESQKLKNNSGVEHSQPDRTQTSGIVLENVSIQGSYHFDIENKSCDATNIKESKDIQTSHNDPSLESHSVEVIISHCCNLHNGLSFNCASKIDEETKSHIISGKSLYTSQTSSNTSRSINKEVDTIISQRSLRVPYIGYTLNCSCDNKLGSCSCSKSLSQSYIKHIVQVWKMLDINKKLLPNVSYIMRSIPKRSSSDENITNFVEVAEPLFVPAVMPESQSVKNVSVSNREEITLKYSDNKLKNNDNNDNMTSTLDDLISVRTECLNEEDATYWYDCCSPRPHYIKNEMMHNKSLYDSIYFPNDKRPKHGKSDTSIKNNVRMCLSKSKNCNCVMVPVCHVKMLVENIESKLVNSQCTCDSFSAQICPFHSKTQC